MNNEISYTGMRINWYCGSALLDAKVYLGADIMSDHHFQWSSFKLCFKQKQDQKHPYPYMVDKLKTSEIVASLEICSNCFYMLPILMTYGPVSNKQFGIAQKGELDFAEENQKMLDARQDLESNQWKNISHIPKRHG